jgi:hypothetical protein
MRVTISYEGHNYIIDKVSFHNTTLETLIRSFIPVQYPDLLPSRDIELYYWKQPPSNPHHRGTHRRPTEVHLNDWSKKVSDFVRSEGNPIYIYPKIYLTAYKPPSRTRYITAADLNVSLEPRPRPYIYKNYNFPDFKYSVVLKDTSTKVLAKLMEEFQKVMIQDMPFLTKDHEFLRAVYNTANYNKLDNFGMALDQLPDITPFATLAIDLPFYLPVNINISDQTLFPTPVFTRRQHSNPTFTANNSPFYLISFPQVSRINTIFYPFDPAGPLTTVWNILMYVLQYLDEIYHIKNIGIEILGLEVKGRQFLYDPDNEANPQSDDFPLPAPDERSRERINVMFRDDDYVESLVLHRNL